MTAITGQTTLTQEHHIRTHRLSVPMIGVIESVGRASNGTVDSWTMKNVILTGVQGANATTVKALISRGIVEEIVRDNDGTPGSLTAYRLTNAGIEIVVAFIGDQATVTEHTMSNGDTAYRAECLHGWATGFHAETHDASDVAKGHGDVSRPLYAAQEKADFAARLDDDLIADGTLGDFCRCQNWASPAVFDALIHYAADRDACMPGGDAPASAVERPRFSKVKNTSRARRYRRGA